MRIRIPYVSNEWHEPEGGVDFKPRERLKSMPHLYFEPLVSFIVVTATTIVLQEKLQTYSHVRENVYDYLTGIIITLTLACAVAWGFYLKRDRIRSIQNHSIYHNIRDKFIVSLEEMRQSRAKGWDKDSVVLLGSFCNDVCELFAEHFRELCRCGDIGCSIRVRLHGDALITAGHSAALRPRIQHTEPISINAGLPKALKEKGYKKAVIIRDIQRAAREDIWSKTKNCNDKSIRSVIALPINLKTERQMPVLLGILYITSSRRSVLCPFTSRSAEQACGFADAIAVHLYGFIEAVKMRGSSSLHGGGLKKIIKQHTEIQRKESE